tara:strand:- start:668 stop:907 length:240 start_codon:yes stop_codon:yes gene_type:complete
MLKFSNKVLLILAVVAGFFSPTMLLAAEREQVVVSDLGPQVGEQVPDFQLSDQFGELQNLESIMGPNGAMILFHRSADW